MRSAGREKGELVNGESPEAAICFAISSLVELRIFVHPGLTLDTGVASDAEGGLSASVRDIVQLNGLCPFDVLADDGDDSGLAERGDATEFCDEDIILCGDGTFPFARVTGLSVCVAVFFKIAPKSPGPWLFINDPPKISSSVLFCIKSADWENSVVDWPFLAPFQEFEGEGKLNGNWLSAVVLWLLPLSVGVGTLLNGLDSGVSANDMKEVFEMSVLYWLGVGRAYWPYGEVEGSTCIEPEGDSSIKVIMEGSKVVNVLQSTSLNGLGEGCDDGTTGGSGGGVPKKLNGA